MQENLSMPTIHQPTTHSKHAFKEERRHSSHISKFENVLNVCKAGRVEAMPSSML
jgi:hypothetical protein